MEVVESRGRTMNEHSQVIARVAKMVHDEALQRRVGGHGLRVVNVMWEDCARYKGSAVGPNISDMTLQIQHGGHDPGRRGVTLLPVIRAPNFSDRTGDVPLERLFLLAGNHAGRPLELVSLREFLGDLRRFLTEPDAWDGPGVSLLADGETHALVSPQTCFLPVARGGVATFNPVLFNYQSRPADPAVLAILATPEGTSVTVIDNGRDPFAPGQVWGQRLFFNHNGQRASLTGRRLSDVVAAAGAGEPRAVGYGLPVDRESAGGVNTVLLIQVPLRQRPRPVTYGAFAQMDFMEMERGISMPPDLEDAVIGHGELEGPFTEIAGLPIERDPRYPVRVTVQFYKATSTGEIDDRDLAQIAALQELVYLDADFTGSLVLDDARRPTQWSDAEFEPPGWWSEFWDRFEEDAGTPRAVAIARLRAAGTVLAWGSQWDLRRELVRRGYRVRRPHGG